METTYSYLIDDRAIHVVDRALDSAEIQKLSKQFALAPFIRSEADGPETQHIRTFNADVDLDAFTKSVPHAVVTSSVKQLFPKRDLALHRVHCNLTVYGDAGFPHRDCLPTRDDVTALIFVNAIWQREWGGELTFFNAKEDAVLVVMPRPGRLVVFEGAVEHRVGVPLRTCFEARMTLACKFKTPGEQW